MNIIAAKHHKQVLASKEMKQLVATLDADKQKSWNLLVSVARGPINKNQMATLLHRIRKYTGFHYGSIHLEAGYRRQFYLDAQTAPTEANRAPQYSIGNDMDATRFYYADAAAQQVIRQLGIDNGAPDAGSVIVDLASEMNLALAALIGAFIKSRDPNNTD